MLECTRIFNNLNEMLSLLLSPHANPSHLKWTLTLALDIFNCGYTHYEPHFIRIENHRPQNLLALKEGKIERKKILHQMKPCRRVIIIWTRSLIISIGVLWTKARYVVIACVSCTNNVVMKLSTEKKNK